jgi:hypothetical protein
MWEPRPLTTQWVFRACYKDSFTFYVLFTLNLSDVSSKLSIVPIFLTCWLTNNISYMMSMCVYNVRVSTCQILYTLLYRFIAYRHPNYVKIKYSHNRHVFILHSSNNYRNECWLFFGGLLPCIILWRICSRHRWATDRWARSSARAAQQYCWSVSFVSAHARVT